MPTNVLMPALSPTMTEGNLVKWNVKKGDKVRAGDVLAEIETDKATMEVEAVDEGVVDSLVVPEGTQGVQVNAVIAVLVGDDEDGAAATDKAEPKPADSAPEKGDRSAAGQASDQAADEAAELGDSSETEPSSEMTAAPGEKPAASVSQAGADADRGPPRGTASGGTTARADDATGPASATPLAARMAQQAGLDLRSLSGSGPHGRITKQDVEAALSGSAAAGAHAPAPSSRDDARVFASPLARRMAEQSGLALDDITGSGPNGRIIARDVEAAARQPAPPKKAPAVEPARAAPPQAKAEPAAAKQQPVAAKPADIPGMPPYELIPHTSMRKVIARRLTESKQSVPHFYLTVDCEVDQLFRMRQDINEQAGDKGARISVNDFVVKACALALRKVPDANASWSEEGIRRWQSVDISVAVALPGGLITPILRDADQKGLATLSAEMRDLATRAREGKLKPEEFQGGTFSISNLGMYGIRQFDAVINPPQACILAVGASEQRPVVKDGQLAVATMMTCTLSCDHRVVDGALGAQWLAAFKVLIEKPAMMLL